MLGTGNKAKRRSCTLTKNPCAWLFQECDAVNRIDRTGQTNQLNNKVMKAKNLLPENYAAQCVKNWSKKEVEFNALTKIEKIAVLESMHKVDPTEKFTFSENVLFDKLTKDEKIAYLLNPVNRGKEISVDTYVERKVSTTYDKVSLLAKIKFLLTKVENPEKLVLYPIPIGIERVKAIYSFMKSFENIEALMQFIEETETETEETETEETEPQK